MKSSNYDSVIKANIDLHTALSDKYNSDEPHFRPENVQKVKNHFKHLKDSTSSKTLLDIGCGTGFMINIARDLGFERIVGYDITPAMINKVDKSGKCSIETQIVDVTKTFPAESNTFDMVSAYTFLSHLSDLQSTFNEVARVLKKDGVFYSDLDPNYYFWTGMETVPDHEVHHPYLQREVNNTKNNDKLLQEKYGIDPIVYNTAEHQKTKTGGMKEEVLKTMLLNAGFSKVVFRYNWFVGQAVINNDPNLDIEERRNVMASIESYLQATLPLSRSLYKYIAFEAYK